MTTPIPLDAPNDKPERQPGDIDYATPAILPDDDGAALDRLTWHARMARRYDDEALELEARYTAEIDRLMDARDYAVGKLRAKRDWHTAPIEQYHRAHPDNRTLDLVHARSKLRVPKKATVFIDDAETVAEWCRTAHPELLRGPNVTAVRGVVSALDDGRVVDAATGEVVPGVHAEVPAPTVHVDLDPGSPL